jgi:hypothetical protein
LVRTLRLLPAVLATAATFAGAALLAPGSALASAPFSVPGTTVGLPSQISLYETAANATYSIATPAGEHPVELSGEVTVSASFGAGYLQIENSAGTVLRVVRLPSAANPSGQQPFTVSLAGLLTTKGLTAVTFVERGGNTPACTVPPRLTLSSLVVKFAGTPTAPRTIDDFFPTGLQRVTIYTSATPTTAEEQAVIELTTALTANYGLQSVAVKALPASGQPAVPTSSFDRTVVIRQGGNAAVSVIPGLGGGSILQLTGDPSSLPHQASLFASSLASLAHSARVAVNRPAQPSVAIGASSYTFSQLNLAATMSVYGTQTTALPIDEAQFGPSVSSITVHLIGAYTPVGPQGEGTLTASVQNIPLLNLRLNASGSFNTTFTIPHELLSRSTVIELTADYSPGIVCVPDTPAMVLAVYPQSYVTADHSSKLLGGFPSLPQSFVKGMDVALQASSISELNAAAETAAGMQALTSVALRPQVIPFQQAATSDNGTLIIANQSGIKQLRLNPPLGENAGQLSAALPGHPNVSVGGGFAAIEAFANPAHNRNVLLVTTTGGWQQLNSIFRSIASTGWYALVGDSYASVNGGTPVDLTIRSSGVSTVTPPPPTSLKWQIVFIAAGGVALAILFFLLGLWRGHRRRKVDSKKR